MTWMNSFTAKLKMPIGISDFETIRKRNAYYVDKSSLISELINLLNFVTLCCGILTIETSDCFFRSFCSFGQNGAFSTTEQNQ